GNAFAVHDVELGTAEGRSDLVLYNFDLSARTELFLPVLDAGSLAYVVADAGVKFQRITARGRFGIAVHDADFVAQLVDEDADRFGFADACGQFSEGLRHQPGLQAHFGITHVALDFRLGRQCRHRVDDDDVDSTGPN